MSTSFKTISAQIHLADVYSEFPEIRQDSELEKKSAVTALLRERFRGSCEQIDVQLNETTALIKWAIPKNPPEVENLNKKAVQFAKNNDLPNALAHWREALATSPNDPDYHYNLGIALYETREYKKCIERLEETVNICPVYARAFFVLGSIYSRMRQFDEAISNLEKGIKFQPENLSGLISLGAVFSIQKDYNNAIAAFEKCISVSAKEPRAYLGLGKIYAIQGDTDNANRCFRAVVKIDPDGKLGAIAKKSMLVEKKVESIAIDATTDVDILYTEGYQAYIKGDYERASQYYSQYLKRKTKDVDVMSSLASCQLRMGECAQASSTIQGAIALKPNNATLFKQAAIIHDACGKSKDSGDAAQKAFDLGKKDSIILTLLGKSSYASGKKDEALKYLSDAIKQNPNNINARFHFAKILKKLGQNDSARQHFEEVLWAKCETPLKKQAQEELEGLL